jgi:transcriptional regulator with XRE-family HTH domain
MFLQFCAMSERETATVSVNGLALREIRKRTGVTTVALATEVGITRAHLANLELGHRKKCSVALYAALIRALNIEDYRTLQTSVEREPAVA